jgi:hypothetical protein
VEPEPQCTPTPTPTPSAYACDKCGKEYGCLTFSRFEALLKFAFDTGMRFVFGLNGCHGHASVDSPMDFANARALLNRTRRSPYRSALHALELGNELIKGYVSPAAMAADFATLRVIVHDLWAGDGAVPLIAGADELRNMGPCVSWNRIGCPQRRAHSAACLPP